MGDIDASLQESSIDKTGIDDEELCLEFEGLMKEIEKQDREEKERAKSVVGQKWGMRTSLPSVSQPSPIQTGSGKVGAKVESKLKLPIGVRSSTPPARKIGDTSTPIFLAGGVELLTPMGSFSLLSTLAPTLPVPV